MRDEKPMEVYSLPKIDRGVVTQATERRFAFREEQ
jgi:hypothetical protein